jgi:SAM-dependent methyltransferase
MPEPQPNWNDRYATGNAPWDSGQSSRELERILGEKWFAPSRMLEIGCGTGTNAIFLAQRGFDVTAVDVAPLALDKARAKAAASKVKVNFRQADALALPDLGGPFPFVFDRGVYHHLRQVDLQRFLASLARVSQPGGCYLTLAGNANDSAPAELGPPRVHAHELCQELRGLFDLVQLREFRFDGVVIDGRDVAPLAWSALLRRK